jgi:hypothetical protein
MTPVPVSRSVGEIDIFNYLPTRPEFATTTHFDDVAGGARD